MHACAQTFPCPHCGRLLPCFGQLALRGKQYPFYQCDSCVVRGQLFDEDVDVLLTFVVTPEGGTIIPSSMAYDNRD